MPNNTKNEAKYQQSTRLHLLLKHRISEEAGKSFNNCQRRIAYDTKISGFNRCLFA
jgi:hypothetical protein